MKFSTPIELKLSDDLSIIVPSAWLNSKGFPIAECQLYNGALLHSDTVAISNNTARQKFVKSVLKRATVEAGEIEAALLEIGGSITTTLAEDLAADKDDRKPTQSTKLIEIAGDAELFRDPNGETYATIQVNDHKETWRLKTGGFRNWLLGRYYKETGGSANAQALQDALGVLNAKATFEGPENPVFLRVGAANGRTYVDLCNDKWEVVEIGPDGWRVISDPPVKFRRTPGMLALPYPVAGGAIEELRQFVNIGSDADWVLFCSWLVQALRPVGPYPVLAFHGEQGSSKSTSQTFARCLIDPNASPLRTEPRSEHDLIIAANNGWVIALDNLSNVSIGLSNSLCRLSTGGGFSVRQLYTDSEEVLYNTMRPAMLNGIAEVVNRSDLLDRTLIVYLPRITEDNRRTMAELSAEFESARPRVLGALFNAVSAALKNLPTTNLERKPRMADFALWASAAEEGFGFNKGLFIDAYMGNRETSNELVIEASPVAQTICTLVEKEKLWTGSAKELLTELNSIADEKTQHQRTWPRQPNLLSARLRNLGPNLRAAGVEVEFGNREGHKGKKIIRLEWCGQTSSASSAPTAQSLNTKNSTDEEARSADGPVNAEDAYTDSTKTSSASGDSANCNKPNVKPKTADDAGDAGDQMQADSSRPPAQVSFIVTREMRQALADLGYGNNEVDQMTHTEARQIIDSNQVKASEPEFRLCPTCGNEGIKYSDCAECGDLIR